MMRRRKRPPQLGELKQLRDGWAARWPEALALWSLLKGQLALATRGIRWEGGPGRVACILVCFQRSTYTFAALSPYLGQAGFAKINLNPVDWRDPDDRARFLDSCNPEIYTGDPISFAELAKLPLTTRPKALVSTAMALLPGLRQQLEARFGCPVVDLYAMNEAGPIAVADDEGHVLLQHRLYVEILDPDGVPCRPGERGEVTLSGGFNPFIPLLRYRTGDYASLLFRGLQPVLVGLEGRPPVVARGTAGQPINNVDVTAALNPFALPQFGLHQHRDGSVRLRLRRASADHQRLRVALLALFGADQALTIEELETLSGDGGKVVQYTSEAMRTDTERAG